MEDSMGSMFDAEFEYKYEEIIIEDKVLKLKSVEEHNCHVRSQVSQVRLD